MQIRPKWKTLYTPCPATPTYRLKPRDAYRTYSSTPYRGQDGLPTSHSRHGHSCRSIHAEWRTTPRSGDGQRNELGMGRQRRWGHAQAAKEDEIPDQLPEDQSRSMDPQQTFDSTTESLPTRVGGGEDVDATVQTQNTAAITLDRLIGFISKIQPSATPVAKISQCVLAEHEEGVEYSTTDICIELANAEYDILCTQRVTLADQTHESFEQIYNNLAEDYIQQLRTHIDIADTSELDEPLNYLQTLRSMLQLKHLHIDRATIDFDFEGAEHLQLCRATAYCKNEPLGEPQVWCSPMVAERLARASADADILRRADQAGIDLESIRAEIEISRSTRKGKSAKRQRSEEKSRKDLSGKPYDASFSHECMSAMIYTLNELRQAGLPDKVSLKPLEAGHNLRRKRSRPSRDELQAISDKLLRTYLKQDTDPRLDALRKQRNRLPIRQLDTSSQLYTKIQSNDVSIVVSETGSGKTTQVPQILLERAVYAGHGAMCNIICTQPRRIAATSVAARVAQERGTFVGGSVGYHVRFDCKMPEQLGSINYSTAGILLKRLQEGSEELLSETSHIIIDEIHERDLTVDLLLCFIRDLIRSRKSSGKSFPKIILMSATVNSVAYAQYFAGTTASDSLRVASITIPGRTYSVTTHMLDDFVPELVELYCEDNRISSLLSSAKAYLEWEDDFTENFEQLAKNHSMDLIETSSQNIPAPELNKLRHVERDAEVPKSLITAVIAHILSTEKSGDILVFLPGMAEMDAVLQMLQQSLPPKLGITNDKRIRIFKLHSQLFETNAEVFEPVPVGCRRIILATNIAQTSITLPGIVHVIDSGKHRTMSYDQINRKSDFFTTWADQATAQQRKGRAGRVQQGHYWAMYTGVRHRWMPEMPQPEIQIADLSSSCLVLKSYSDSIDLRQFFARTLDPPDSEIVEACVDELKGLGMLTPNENLTALGYFCGEFPLHPAAARGLLIGRMFQCLSPFLVTATHDDYTPLLNYTDSKRDLLTSAVMFAGLSEDDRYAYIQAFEQYDAAVQSGSHNDIAFLESKHVKANAYHLMLNKGRQLYEDLSTFGLVDGTFLKGIGKRDSVFQYVEPDHDKNSHNVVLYKALALSLVQNKLAVFNGSGKKWLVRDEACMLGPGSVNSVEGLRASGRPKQRKRGELVGFGRMIDRSIDRHIPWLSETSSVTPLMAMLFGGPIVVLDDNTIEIDGWLRYRITVARPRSGDGQMAANNIPPAIIIYESRKALDRVMTLTFSALRRQFTNEIYWRKSTELPPTIPKPKPEVEPAWSIHSPRRTHLQNIITERLAEILNMDVSHWDDVIYEAIEE